MLSATGKLGWLIGAAAGLEGGASFLGCSIREDLTSWLSATALSSMRVALGPVGGSVESPVGTVG